MSTYRVEWECCGQVTETDAWEPTECPFCVKSIDLATIREVIAELRHNRYPFERELADKLDRAIGDKP